MPDIVLGTVREWHDEDGWGVIVAQEGRLIWAHFSAIEAPMSSYRSLSPGASVELGVHEAWQDGYDFRATYVRAAADGA